ncbi:MAG: ATP-grasp domain-containing protein [Thermodesulfovibrionia bacterium]|nr:ATP-grasp domain-containing protein [Thermodesulfovibrionia bacterium]
MTMHKTIILVSAVCGDIGCSAVRALRDSVDKIIGCDIQSNSPVIDLIDRFYVSPPALDRDNYINFLKKVFQKDSIGFFLPISEYEIDVLNTRREELESTGVRLLLNNKEVLNNFLDKLKTAQYLNNIGITAPKTSLLCSYDGSFGFPVIVKARKGSGSKRLWTADNSTDLEYIKTKDDGGLIAQEMIGSAEEEYTTGVFSDGQAVSAITFRRRLGFGGLSVEAVLEDIPFLDNIARKISKETGLTGSINIQSRRAGDIFIPYEINPRLSSTLLFRKKFGFDDAVWWLDALMGKKHSYKMKYKSGIAKRSLTECYFDLQDIVNEDR